MITILSPAKNLDFKPQQVTSRFTLPDYQDESEKLVERVRKLSRKQMSELMEINARLTNLNYERFRLWNKDFTPQNAKQAILAFNGDVYTGLAAKTLRQRDLDFAQDNLLILSGLHGMLRPLDLVQPYRLEMGIGLKLGRANSLVAFWQPKITEALNKMLKKHKQKTIINLASNEYSQCIDRSSLDAEWITPTFREMKGDGYRVFFVFLKRARGMMARFIIENRITRPEDIKGFDLGGYFYNEPLSTADEWVFAR